ncbi:MAG: histidine kinase [Bacteroidales bacterium]|nr:histidine kinase [Bacteroidales bacterium]MCM1415306.1 histidine kinase [bacterium]MCM1423461.1 histidine kinase [bacterium]
MFFNRFKIKRQMYQIYGLVVVVPVLLIGAFLIAGIYRLMIKDNAELVHSDNYRVRNVLFDLTRELYGISKDISFDDGVRGILATEFASRQAYVSAVDQNEILSKYAQTYAQIGKIEIFTDNPYLSEYKQFVQVDEETAGMVWYTQALEKPGVFWRAIPWNEGYRDSTWDLCLVKGITLVNTPYHAVLVIHIDTNYLQIWTDSTEYESVMSVDRGAVFYASDTKRLGLAQPITVDYEEPYFQYSGIEKVDGQTCFVEVATLHAYQSRSRIYLCSLDKKGCQNIRNIMIICALITLTALVIPGILLYFFTRSLTGRITLLRQEMHKVSNQDYELIPAFRGEDELSEAFGDLQVMVENIKEQEARAFESQLTEQELLIRQQEMEFKVLSSQINPHFLYNTLETIRMRAFAAGDKEVAKAIKLLGKSMRYVLENFGASFTTLAEELHHVEEYIEIQQLRFGERIRYEEEIEAGLVPEECRMLPLLLQPVVENAIIHGLDDIEAGGLVKVSACKKKPDAAGEEFLIVDVEDNGCGMTEEVLGRLRRDIEIRDMSRSKSIGLYNINQRIKLHYGEGYRIHIYAEPEKGTRVRLVLPADKLRD